MIKTINRYFKFWLKQASVSFTQQLVTNSSTIIFIFGKVFRFLMYYFFITFLLSETNSLAGYTKDQALFIFLSYFIIDTLSQVILRGTYVFRNLVIDGTFDFFLIQPINPLFRALTRYTDVIDLLTAIPLIGYTIYFISVNNFVTSPITLVLYLFFMFNSLLLAVSFHIFVAAFCVIFLEIDNLLWLYRDVTSMGRFPIDIYRSPVREFITYLLPLGLMFLVPARVLLNLNTSPFILLSLFVGPLFVFVSYRFWLYSLKKYSSASS